ncbi:MAG: TldD/PmbA family protein, partial [Lachnospiraceae bacterium]|nr:TldD/PmbA family protein [Lachnospiraceae bacterium]
MKVKESAYLQEKKPVLKRLLDELLSRYEYASILATDSLGKIYSVSKTGTNIREDANLTERGFCVKICNKGEIAEYSFNEISDEAIPGILKDVEENLISLDGAIPEGIEAYHIDGLSDEKIVLNESTEYEEDPEELGNEKIIKLLTRISEKGRAYDERFVNCSAAFSYQKYTKMFLSRNKDMTQNVMWSAAWLVVMGAAGEEIKDSYQPMSILGGSEILKNLEGTLETACKTCIELFDAQPIEPGEYECICMPDVTGMIVHEAFGHGVEMDMFVKDRALAQQYVGKPVASELITMHDGASTIPEVATFFFDDEGIPAHDTIIIKNGILQTGICDLQSAAHL